jgi:osmotically-inducible protein OsmY
MAIDHRRPQTSPVTKDPNRRLSKEYFISKSTGRNSPPDLQIQDELWTKLQQEPGLDLTEIEVDINDGYVLLTGTVLDENTRGHIEHKALLCRGVRQVENQIHVLRKFRDVENR